MYKNFNLTESERERILDMHKEHGYKKALNEQEMANPSKPDDDDMIKKLLAHYGFKKEMEKMQNNGLFIEGYGNGKKINIILTKKDGTNIAKILYRGPEFGNPDNVVNTDLTFEFFKKEWMPVTVDNNTFPNAIEAALKHAKTIGEYNESKPLREEEIDEMEVGEGDINEGFGRDISVQMAIWSHLSDIEYDSPEQRKIRCNFIKLLVAKYIPNNIEVNEDKLDALYDQVSNRDFSGSALDEPAMDDMNEGWRDIFGEPDVKDAARSAYKSQGHSMMGSDDEQREGEYYTVFNGEKFFSNQIEYADYQDMGDLQRV